MKEEWLSEYQRKYCLDCDLIGSVERAQRVETLMGGEPFSEERICIFFRRRRELVATDPRFPAHSR
jgi:hypothetical protein